jgi:hypothetical protein
MLYHHGYVPDISREVLDAVYQIEHGVLIGPVGDVLYPGRVEVVCMGRQRPNKGCYKGYCEGFCDGFCDECGAFHGMSLLYEVLGGISRGFVLVVEAVPIFSTIIDSREKTKHLFKGA